MLTPKRVEKMINKELGSIKKTAVKEVVKAGLWIGATFFSATAITALLAKDETKGVKTEDYSFDCSGLSATNDGRMVVVTLEEGKKLKNILKDYHWLDGTPSKLGKVVLENGKETLFYNTETGEFVNEARGFTLMLAHNHRDEVNKFFED